MLQIRQEQYEVLLAEKRERFVDRVLKYLRRQWPEECEMRDEKALRKLINLGRDDAEKHLILGEADVVSFVEFVLVLGPNFKENPEFPWAGRILDNPDTDGTMKVEQLRLQTVKHLKRTGGGGN